MNIPRHVAVIMDGNGRWAKQRGLPRSFGHKKGADRVRELIGEAKCMGIKVLTVFAFSTENWARDQKEIEFLFYYLGSFLRQHEKELLDNGIKFRMIGRRDRINKKVINQIEAVEKKTKNNQNLLFNMCLDYGGRWDIVAAVKAIARNVFEQKIKPADINEQLFVKYLSLDNIVDPDLLIRTSGEQRISNFLLWNLAYSELYFPKVLWPDFDKAQLHKAVEVYSQRDRKFGKV